MAKKEAERVARAAYEATPEYIAAVALEKGQVAERAKQRREEARRLNEAVIQRLDEDSRGPVSSDDAYMIRRLINHFSFFEKGKEEVRTVSPWLRSQIKTISAIRKSRKDLAFQITCGVDRAYNPCILRMNSRDTYALVWKDGEFIKSNGFDFERSMLAILKDLWTCEHRGSHQRIQLIKSTLSDTPCDVKCLNAEEKKCVCSCGGVNHQLTERGFIKVYGQEAFNRLILHKAA